MDGRWVRRQSPTGSAGRGQGTIFHVWWMTAVNRNGDAIFADSQTVFAPVVVLATRCRNGDRHRGAGPPLRACADGTLLL